MIRPVSPISHSRKIRNRVNVLVNVKEGNSFGDSTRGRIILTGLFKIRDVRVLIRFSCLRINSGLLRLWYLIIRFIGSREFHVQLSNWQIFRKDPAPSNYVPSFLVSQSVTYLLNYLFPCVYIHAFLLIIYLRTHHSGGAVWGMNSLRLLECWARGFEFVSRNVCLCAFILFVLFYKQVETLTRADPPSKEPYTQFTVLRNLKPTKAQ
jgi:hypothetical protein